MKVILNLHIDVNDINEETAIANAIEMVGRIDTMNEATVGEELVTKLYYIVPKLGKIIVVVNDADKDVLGVESNILANINIASYPLERLPAQMVAYKELIIKKGNDLSSEDILNAAQAIVDAMPYDLVSVVKVINYNDDLPSKLVMQSIYGDNIFSSVSGVVNNGDAEAGQDVIDTTNAKDGQFEGWSLLHQFASHDGKLAYPSTETIEGKIEGINSADKLDAAGISYNLNSINDGRYHIEENYMKAYYSGGPKGYIEVPLPDNYDTVMVEYGNWYGQNYYTYLYVGGTEVQRLGGNHGHETYVGPYKPGDTIKLVEDGIFWIKAIWVKKR